MKNQPATAEELAAAGAEKVLAAMLWKYRHIAGGTLVCQITEDDLEQLNASLTYTKQKPAVAIIARGPTVIVSMVEAGTVLKDKDGKVTSAGNEIRPCESDTAQQAIAEASRERKRNAQAARELSGRLLGALASGTYSEAELREAANLLIAMAGQE